MRKNTPQLYHVVPFGNGYIVGNNYIQGRERAHRICDLLNNLYFTHRAGVLTQYEQFLKNPSAYSAISTAEALESEEEKELHEEAHAIFNEMFPMFEYCPYCGQKIGNVVEVPPEPQQ